jgi:hypothetical protein
MRKGKFVVKAVPVTANNITTAVMNFLESEGHLPARINTEGQFVPIDSSFWRWDSIKDVVSWLHSLKLVIGWFRKTNSTLGVSDTLTCLRPIGKYLAIEIKHGKDRLRPEQSKYLQDVKAAGGLAYVVHSYTEFLEIYNNEIKPLLNEKV